MPPFWTVLKKMHNCQLVRDGFPNTMYFYLIRYMYMYMLLLLLLICLLVCCVLFGGVCSIVCAVARPDGDGLWQSSGGRGGGLWSKKGRLSEARPTRLLLKGALYSKSIGTIALCCSVVFGVRGRVHNNPRIDSSSGRSDWHASLGRPRTSSPGDRHKTGSTFVTSSQESGLCTTTVLKRKSSEQRDAEIFQRG